MALKLQNRRWYPFILLIGPAAITIAWLSFPREHHPELLVSIAAFVAGFSYFLYSQHLDETKLFRELFLEFNRRYDGLNDSLNAIVFGPTEGLLSSEEREHLFDYFNLCAEEYFFYTAGYIDHRVWEAWLRGMKVFFKYPRVQALWEQDCKADSYYEFRPPE